MGKVVISAKKGQSFKAGDFICHIVNICAKRLTVCVEAPNHVAVTRHELLVRNENGELDHPKAMVARTQNMRVKEVPCVLGQHSQAGPSVGRSGGAA